MCLASLLRRHRGGGILLFLLASCAAPLHAADPEQAQSWVQPREQDLRLLEVRLGRHVLADVITGYHHPAGALLPLGELSRLLGLAIVAHPEHATADGFILSEDRRFFLDVARAEVTLNGERQGFSRGSVSVHQDDLYVEAGLLSKWLPLDLEVDLFASVLYVHPREPLPFQQRLEREQLMQQTRTRLQPKDPGYPSREWPSRMWSTPFIDQTIKLSYRDNQGDADSGIDYTTFFKGDLVHLETTAYVSGSEQEPFRDYRLTMGRKDPDAGLLGALGAREYAFGHVSVPEMSLVSHIREPGLGVLLSSYPLSRQSKFDRHTFQGDLPPGWDVELYHNNALFDYQQASANGRYSFEDVPLIFGTNYFRLVFYGPYGQQRVEEHRFILGASLTPAGEHHYRLAAQQTEDNGQRIIAQLDSGLHKHLSLNLGFTSLELDDVPQRYASVGLRSYLSSLFAQLDIVKQGNGASAFEIGLQTQLGRVSTSLTHTRLSRDFSSEQFEAEADPIQSRSRLRLDTAIPQGWLPRLPITLESQWDRHYSGKRALEINQRIYAYFHGMSLSNQLRWEKERDSPQQFDGSLRVSRYMARYGLRGELFYDFEPKVAWNSLSLAVEGPLRDGYRFNGGVHRSFNGDQHTYSLGIVRSLGSYTLGLDTSMDSDGDLSLNLTLQTSLGHEPRRSHWLAERQLMAAGGSASVQVFLDDNGNGLFDPDEQPIEGARVTIDGSQHSSVTDAGGIAFVRDLPVHRSVNIGLSTRTLEDPLWVPQVKGVKTTPRPGTVMQIDFPVRMTGEVDGTVYLKQGAYLRELGDVELQLVDERGTVVVQGKSAFDGFYILSKVPPGRYRLRVAPEQLERFGLMTTAERRLTITTKEPFVSGMDMTLSMQGAMP